MSRALFVPDSELDVGLCVSSGQVFRWSRAGEDWVGADGPNVIKARRVTGGWKLQSWPDLRAARRFFQLERSLQTIRRRISKLAPELRPFIRAHHGLRTLRPARAEETLFSFLCTPNNNLVRITRMVFALGAYGQNLADGLYEFPTAERIAAIPEAELRAKGFGYRARTIGRVARQLLERQPGWLDGLRQLPYEEARARLCDLNGVGLKVADCVCLFGLGQDEAVPVDTHLWQAACELYFPAWRGGSLTERRYRAVGDLFRERFGRLAGWAHQYLFYDRMLAFRRGSPPV